MANLLAPSQEVRPQSVSIRTDFYDKVNEGALMTSAARGLLSRLKLPKTLDIPTADILTYYLFYKKRPGTRGFGTYAEIAPKISHALEEWDGLVEFRNDSIGVISREGMNSGTTERLGEAIGLSVLNAIHESTEADWYRIPVRQGGREQSMDFQYAASDGTCIIKVECKGTISLDARAKSSNVSKQKATIEAQKRSERVNDGTVSKTVYYGTIAVLDAKADTLARCWLVDPPADESVDPRRFRIIARLTYIADLISFISPHSALSVALQTRLAALRALSNIDELDGITLRKGDGMEFIVGSRQPGKPYDPWIALKSRVIESRVGGRVFRLDSNTLFFLGIQEELLHFALRQAFDSISSYRSKSFVSMQRVWCTVSAGYFKHALDVVTRHVVRVIESDGYMHFELQGVLYYSSGGIVFGVLPLPR